MDIVEICHKECLPFLLEEMYSFIFDLRKDNETISFCPTFFSDCLSEKKEKINEIIKKCTLDDIMIFIAKFESKKNYKHLINQYKTNVQLKIDANQINDINLINTKMVTLEKEIQDTNNNIKELQKSINKIEDLLILVLSLNDIKTEKNE